jgi:CMP-N-acetylneuraminic acid synthetase
MSGSLFVGGTVAVVPVRDGSKRLSRKNLMPFHGVPLYLRAVEQGLRNADNVILSTDIEEISRVDLPDRCHLSRRPSNLATDEMPMAPVIRQIIDDYALEGVTMMLLQATSPLRLDSDIAAAIDLFETGRFDMVMSVIQRDSDVLKYGTIKGGHFTALRNQDDPFLNQQALPEVFGPNGAVYIFNSDSFLNKNSFPVERIGVFEMPSERSIDIDTLEDFHLAEQSLPQKA